MPAKKPSILIIDPDQTLCAILAKRFEPAWTVKTAAKIEDASRRLSRSAPSLVLLDAAAYPDALGFVRALRMQPKTWAVPVVCFSKTASRSQVREAAAAGAQGYLLKTQLSPARLRSYLEEKIKP